jgi:hypothetical protein
MPNKKPPLPISPLGPLSPEERREADKIRLARLEKSNRAHAADLRRQDLDDLRQPKQPSPRPIARTALARIRQLWIGVAVGEFFNSMKPNDIRPNFQSSDF